MSEHIVTLLFCVKKEASHRDGCVIKFSHALERLHLDGDTVELSSPSGGPYDAFFQVGNLYEFTIKETPE